MTFDPSKKTCFLHIGPHKTGSSTIQLSMRMNPQGLDRAGLVYAKLPTPEGKPDRLHKTLTTRDEIYANGLKGPISENWAAVRDLAAAGTRNIILSSEVFAIAFRDRERLDAVLSFFEHYGYETRVIAYVRDQPGWLNSWYVQDVKRFIRKCNFKRYVRTEAETGRVDPWKFLETFIDNPRVTLDVASLDAAARSGLQEDFARRVGVPDGAGFESPKAVTNANAGAKTVYAAQQIMAARPIDLRHHPKYTAIFGRFKERYTALGWDAVPYVALNDASTKEIREHYRASNDRFAQRFLGASTWAELFPDRSYARRVFDPEQASAAEMREVDDVVRDVVAVIDSFAGLEQPARVPIARAKLHKVS